MQKDLATSIIAAIVGVSASYLICNLFIGDIQPASVKVVDSSITPTIDDPNEEIFNYRSLNPTVEVYIGQCQQFDQNGQCMDVTPTEENPDVITDPDQIDYIDGQDMEE